MGCGKVDEVAFCCTRVDCLQAKAEIIEQKSEIRDLQRDNDLQKRELEENSYWVDN